MKSKYLSLFSFCLGAQLFILACQGPPLFDTSSSILLDFQPSLCSGQPLSYPFLLVPAMSASAYPSSLSLQPSSPLLVSAHLRLLFPHGQPTAACDSSRIPKCHLLQLLPSTPATDIYPSMSCHTSSLPSSSQPSSVLSPPPSSTPNILLHNTLHSSHMPYTTVP